MRAPRQAFERGRIHVLHTESVGALGGQTLRLVDEARAFADHTPHRFTIVGREGSPFQAFAEQRVPFVPFRYAKPAWHPANLVAASRLLRALSPDVVHTHSSLDAWIFGLAARRAGIPVVRGRHISKPVPSSFLGRVPFTHLAKAFTVSAPGIGQELERAGVAHERIFLTPAGIDLGRFCPAQRDPYALRAELGLSATTRLIGTACNLRRMKGVDLLVRAFESYVARSGDDAALVIAGSGDPEPFRAQAAAPHRLHFLGFRHDVERVIGGLDLFVLASRAREAMSQVVPQAMALRVPVVTSDAGALPDLVRNGETGTLVPAGDAAALSEAMEAALRRSPLQAQAQCERAQAFVLRHFGRGGLVRRYLEAYAQVLGRILEPAVGL